MFYDGRELFYTPYICWISPYLITICIKLCMLEWSIIICVVLLLQSFITHPLVDGVVCLLVGLCNSSSPCWIVTAVTSSSPGCVLQCSIICMQLLPRSGSITNTLTSSYSPLGWWVVAASLLVCRWCHECIRPSFYTHPSRVHTLCRRAYITCGI
jgi:hypothetical protein